MPQVDTETGDGAVTTTDGSGCSASVNQAADRLARATPGLILGPFYPLQHAADADARLWRGERLPEGVQALKFRVHVVTREGQAVAGAGVELWHADHAGRYPHPSAGNACAALPGFTGYGIARTDAEGCCEFETLVPGAYRTEVGLRARHLHLQISGRFDRLVTQVFLPDDGRRHEDRWYRASTRPDLLVAHIVPAAGPDLRLHWTAVLARG
jgi:protocatechuate 3,4-dioxygenase beta subunit